MTDTKTALRQRLKAAGSALRVRNYRLYFFGQSISVGGSFMQALALAFLVLQTTGSGVDLGIIAAARLLPFVLLGPVGGVIADRYDKRRILYLTQSASAAGAVAFAVLAALGDVNFPVLVVLSLALGCLTVLDNPARQSLIGDLVPRETLANAVILNSVSLNVARVLGSVVGGALVALVGIPLCFVLNAVSFLAVLVSLARMKTVDMIAPIRVPRARGQVREGLRYAVRTPELLLPLLMLTITGILAYEFPITLPLLATEAFHGTSTAYGAMAAVMAGGAIVGGLVAASRSAPLHPSSFAVTAVGWGITILATGIAPTLTIALIALAFVGYGSITFNSTANTTLQLAARPEMRGRIMALWALTWGGSTVIGGPLVGWIAQDVGSRWSLVVGGASTIALGLLLLPYLRKRDRDRKPGPPPRKESSTMPITTIEPSAALVLIDLQKGILGAATTPVRIDTVLANARDLAAAFRNKGHEVVLVNVAGGAPGRSHQHHHRAGAAASRPEGWMDLADELDAQPSDHRVTKATWGAFTGTSLDEHLRKHGVTQVVLGGVATSIGVESTARHAHELGYHVVLATDAMSDRDADAHQNSVRRIFPRLGETGTTADVLRLLT